jgi:hypothetical protein
MRGVHNKALYHLFCVILEAGSLHSETAKLQNTVLIFACNRIAYQIGMIGMCVCVSIRWARIRSKKQGQTYFQDCLFSWRIAPWICPETGAYGTCFWRRSIFTKESKICPRNNSEGPMIQTLDLEHLHRL